MQLSGYDLQGNQITRTATTDARGRYAFANVPAGYYTVTESQPAGYLDGIETVGANGGAASNNAFSNVPIGATPSSVTGYLFGERTASKLKGFVYVDKNNDGAKQSTEQGLAGVVVSLKNASGATVATTTTDSTGAYVFSTVAPCPAQPGSNEGGGSNSGVSLPYEIDFAAAESWFDPASGTAGAISQK